LISNLKKLKSKMISGTRHAWLGTAVTAPMGVMEYACANARRQRRNDSEEEVEEEKDSGLA
jgi:hypothetical protein